MLSTENPPHPPCSSKLPAVRINVRTSSKRFTSQEKDSTVIEERTTPNFSIRDYVFASWSKGIEASWPFESQFFEVCLKHGANDLLLPFKNPDIARAHSLSKVAESAQPAACSEPEKIAAHLDLCKSTDAGPCDEEPASIQQKSVLTLEELVLDCPDSAVHLSPNDEQSIFCQAFKANELIHSNVGVASTVRTSQQAEEILSQSLSRISSEAASQLEVTDPSHKLEMLCDPLEKNRFASKLDTILETCQAENLVNNSSMISHPVASKVCPVCKTFSFTSNTNLDADIDQCLAMGSNCMGVLGDISKYKVKPRRKRLMVDIYATAPRCTLEDLDKRNGTNRASESALMAASTNEVGAHTTRPEVSPTDSTYDGIGAGYVDSDSVKLKILPKTNDQTFSRKNLKLRNDAEESKARKGLLNSKKHFAPKYLKNMIFKAQSKQCTSFNMAKSQIQAAARGVCNTDNNQENDKSPSQVSDSRDQDKSIAATTIKQWACSRRSDILRKRTYKDNCSTLEDMIPVTRIMLAMNDQPYSGKSTDDKTHPKTFSRSSEDLTSSQKTKRVNFLHNEVSVEKRKRKSLEQPFSSENTSLVNGLILKLSRSSGNFTCSSIVKLKEIDMGTQDELESTSHRKMRLPKSCCLMLKDQADSSSKNNVLVRRSFHLEVRKGAAIEKPSISKGFCKNTTLLPSNNMEVCSPTDTICLLSTKEKKSLGLHQSYTPRTVAMFGEGEVMNEMLSSRGNIIEYTDKMEDKENNNNNNLKILPSGVQCHDTETETSGMQFEISDSRDYMTKYSMEKYVTDPIAHDTVNSEKTEPAFSTQLHSCPCEEENAQPISGSEAHAEQLKQVSNEQEMLSADGCCKKSSNDIGNQEIQMAKVQGRIDSCAFQPKEWQAGMLLAQESSGCLTGHGDVGLEMLEKSSSITSHVKYLASERVLSGSPVSTASTISLQSPIDSKSEDSEAELMDRVSRVRDNVHAATPFRESIEATQYRDLEKRKQEIKKSPADKEPEHCLDDKHFFCSCRESISRESQWSRQNGTCRTTKPKEDFAVKFPTCDNICSPKPSPQSQNYSTSSPILRLMGKNLMVVNHEELVQPQTTALVCTQQVRFSSNGYTSTNNHLKQESSLYQHNQLPSVSPSFGPALSMGRHQMPLNFSGMPMSGFAYAPLQNGCTAKSDQRTQQRESFHHIMDNVIVIDDSPERETDLKDFLTSSASNLPLTTSGLSPLPRRPFSCHPLQQ